MDETPPPAPPETDRPAPELPGRWTPVRVLLALFLLAHWVAVLAHAVPDPEAEIPLRGASGLVGRESLPIGEWSQAVIGPELPLPVLDTHEGHELLSMQDVSPIALYLDLTNQGQRWKMFTPRRKMAACLYVHYRTGPGSTQLVRVADPDRMAWPRWVRWRLLEWMLMSDLGIHYYLPHCHRDLVEHLAPGPYRRAGLRKHFAMLPVLHDEEVQPGVDRFQDVETFRARLADPEKLRQALRPSAWIKPERQP